MRNVSAKSKSFNRRTFLATAPAAAAVPSVAYAVPDPVIGMVAEWRKTWRALTEAPEESPEAHALYDDLCEMDEKICTTVARTPEGIRSQLEFMTESFSDFFGAVGDDLDYKLVRSMIEGASAL